MASRRPLLSKSRLISAWQCAKRVHLETHHPELGVISPQTRSLWKTGHQVGAIAHQLFGAPGSVEIEFDERTGLLLRRTREFLEGGADLAIFEATI